MMNIGSHTEIYNFKNKKKKQNRIYLSTYTRARCPQDVRFITQLIFTIFIRVKDIFSGILIGRNGCVYYIILYAKQKP